MTRARQFFVAAAAFAVGASLFAQSAPEINYDANADFLTLHLPLTPESKYLINRRTLGLMKPGAFLINTARGGLVCEADLLEALRAKQIAGYPWFSQKKPWQKEIDLMLKNGFKLEVEALISKDISYVTEQYVPSRLDEGNFLD